MKLGLGLYRHMLHTDNFRFARQAGATHIVAHLTDYFSDGPRIPTQEDDGWGWADPDLEPWSAESLSGLRRSIQAEGLELAALENFSPAHWYDILLDGPKRDEQIETIQAIIRNLGEAGIPVMGYNFSLAGVWGHVEGPWARGGAESVGFLGPDGPRETPIANGTIWNMTYDQEAPTGTVSAVGRKELWSRLARFLGEVLPVAEEAGVALALHPDDPPMPTLRGTARLVYQPRMYQDVLDLHASPSNKLEYCVGSLAEMTEGDIYAFTERYSQQDAIGYVHFRNVLGKVPRYHEVFVDEGDVDMERIVAILAANNFNGVLIPDHTPQMTCKAPWHAGMAYALGYMRGIMRAQGLKL